MDDPQNLTAAVEAGAKALYEAMEIGPWEQANHWMQEWVRDSARTCVEAAAPHLLT